MQDELEATAERDEDPPAGRVAVWGIKAALIMTVVWVALILVGAAWLGVWVAKHLL